MMEGYKETSIGLIPEDWEVASLCDTGDIISGGTPDTSNPDYWNGQIAWCTPTDITGLNGNRYIDKTTRCISGEGLSNSSATLLPENSLVICTRATIGDCAINLIPISTNQGFKSIKAASGWDIIFLYYFIKANKPVLIRQSSGSTFLEISKTAFEKIPIPKPIKSEQSKIASILSTVDDKIDAINERITQTQQLKNGLMQRLLTKGIGHTKFKDSPLGEIPESWDDVKLGDCLEKVVGGGTPSRAIESYWKGKIPWATVKDLKKSILDNTEEYITEIGLKNSASNLIPRKTIIIATRMALGKAVFFTKDVAINQDLKAIFTKPLLFENFLFHWFVDMPTKLTTLCRSNLQHFCRYV